MYVFEGFKFVINLLLYVFLNLNFKLRHVDFYDLGLRARPSIDKARDSSFSLILLAADSLLYNAVSTIRYLFFVTLHVESIACCGNAFYLHAK